MKKKPKKKPKKKINLGFLESLKSFNPFSSNNNPSKTDTSGIEN